MLSSLTQDDGELVEGITAGIVLCGGRSRRMGRPKEMLPFGPERMLQRVVRLLGEAVRPIVAVAAEGQELPDLAEEVRVVRDGNPGRGPLEGMAAGLMALKGAAGLAFVSACDAPLLLPEFVRRMVELAADYDIAVPYLDGGFHPLAGVYRVSVLPKIEELLAAERLRPAFLFDEVRTRRVTADELRTADRRLQSLVNVNSRDDYGAALMFAGFASS